MPRSRPSTPFSRTASAGEACPAHALAYRSELFEDGAMKHDNVRDGSELLPDSLVYVVDDDESIRGALTSLLMSVAIHVRAFESADHFLAALIPDVPRCLILAVRLPGRTT